MLTKTYVSPKQSANMPYQFTSQAMLTKRAYDVLEIAARQANDQSKVPVLGRATYQPTKYDQPKHDAIDFRHILVGLMIEQGGVAGFILREHTKPDIIRSITYSDLVDTQIGVVIADAQYLAKQCGNSVVGTEHILAAILDNPTAAELLANIVDIKQVRARLVEFVPQLWKTHHNYDKLQTFLYYILRDHITSGAIEGVMRAALEADQHRLIFSNEHLIRYAKDIAKRLMTSNADEILTSWGPIDEG